MPDADEKRMSELRQRLERLRDAPGVHREGIDGMLDELSYYEGLPRDGEEWADKEHIRGQFAEIRAAVRWEEDRLGLA